MTTLDKILDLAGSDKFCRFGNADGKYWIMPVRRMRTAMNLYQPSGIKGKMVKSLLPLLHWLPPVRKAIHAELLNCSLKEELRTLLCKVFDTEELEFSIFEGTPSVHQKITMQLSCGSRILGYCKLSESNDIKGLFEKESRILRQLAESGITDIPRALYCGTLTSGAHLFVQSTAKTASSKVIHEWGTLQEKFLEELRENTTQVMLFEDSDFCRTLEALESHIDWLPRNIESKYIKHAIETLRKELTGRSMELSAYHGDFTPWNMFVENGRLFVFDFEYAAKSYPHGLDKYHFFSQTAYFEKGWQAEEIISYMNRDEGTWIDKQHYSMYLLDMISRFTTREGKKVEGSETALFAFWSNLLHFMQEQSEQHVL